LFATEESRWQQLREAFKAHAVDKRYRALVSGNLVGQGTQSLWLRVAQHRPAVVRVVEPGTSGAFSTRLSWFCLETFDAASLLEIQLETGFLHQVRATLAHMGHPVLGDALYGEPSAHGEPSASQPLRQMLHAASLEWGEIRVSSADPPDFAELLASLREGKC
jgi:23S rRNA pseudouridine1911/1915/1917 synthase